MSVFTERQLVDERISRRIDAAINAWAGVNQLIRGAIGDVPELDVDALADHLFVTLEGPFLPARATGDPSCMRRQPGAFRQLLAALLVS